MNRVKKEFRKKGYKIGNDYPCMPFNVSNTVTLLDVVIDSEHATMTRYYNVITETVQLERDGAIDWEVV